MRNDTLSPLFLQSSIGPFAAIGSVGSATPLDIYNPNNTPMLIDQIRFSFERTTQFEVSPIELAGIAIEVLLGSIPLTKGYVTLGALAPRYFGIENEPGIGVNQGGDAGLTWHLPFPLYVPPLVQLSINVKRQPVSPNDPGVGVIDALRVSVVGRSVPRNEPVPGSIRIPFVAETKAVTSADRFVSKDSDLTNSNDVPLTITQLVGVNYNSVVNNVTPTNLTVQASLSNGTMIIRDAIPFFLAFPTDRGLLPLNAKLQPGAFMRMEFENSVPPGAEAYSAGVGFTAVAMHGYRTIQTPGTLG